MGSSRRQVAVLGCTGSVGSNTIDILRQRPDAFQLVALSCGRSVEKLADLAREFSVRHLSVADEESAEKLRVLLSDKDLQIYVGPEGHRELVETCQADVVMASMSGVHGLKACLQAIESQVSILGIANKEILVMAGRLIMRALENSRTTLVPVDSEHSALFQCLMGNRREDVKKVILTASGGPFRKWPKEEFSQITKAQALKHPNWSMGAKITVDSATMMNKGLEYIEALRLFRLKPSEIEIVVHPQSILHSLVEYKDHSLLAQLGVSDMRIPIALALSYPERIAFDLQKSLDLVELGRLDFEATDEEKFPCLRLAKEAEASGEDGPLILNAANEEAVALFLQEKLSFIEIPVVIESALQKYSGQKLESLDQMIDFDALIRQEIRQNWQPSEANHVKLSPRKAAP